MGEAIKVNILLFLFVQFFTSPNSAVSGPARIRRKGKISEVKTDCTGVITEGTSPVRLSERMDTTNARGKYLNSRSGDSSHFLLYIFFILKRVD